MDQTLEGRELALQAGVLIYNGDARVIGPDTAGAAFNKNRSAAGYDSASGTIALNANALDLSRTDNRLYAIGHEGYHALADQAGYGFGAETEELLADRFGASARDVWRAYSYLGGYETDVGGADFNQAAWLNANTDSRAMRRGNAWMREADSASLRPAYLVPPQVMKLYREQGGRIQLGMKSTERFAAAAGIGLDETAGPGFGTPLSKVLVERNAALEEAGIGRDAYYRAAAVLWEKGDTPETVEQYIAQQMGSRFKVVYDKSPALQNYVKQQLAEGEPGKYINVTPLWQMAEGLANAEAARMSPQYRDVLENPGTVYDGTVPLISGWLAEYGRNTALMNDDAAPPFLQAYGRRSLASDLVTDAVMVGVPVRGVRPSVTGAGQVVVLPEVGVGRALTYDGRITEIRSRTIKDEPNIEKPYKRPSGATTLEQREFVQGKPCVDCGFVAPKQIADHKYPLVKEYYETGSIDTARMRSIDAVQPQCPTCSAKQGAEMSRYSKMKKREFGFE